MIETGHCHYQHLSSGLHQFVFVQPDRISVDEHYARLEDIFRQAAPGAVIRVLIDFRYGFPPISYGFARAREFNRQRDDKTGYYAFLYSQSNAMLTVLQSFFGMLPGRNRASFFPLEERDTAIAWLLDKQ